MALEGGHGTVGDAGEAVLLELIAARLPAAPIGETWAGDDAAVVGAPEGHLLLCSDAMTEGVDFETSYASGGDVAWKALAVNASDIAAMGGRPSHALVNLLIPPQTPMIFFEEMLAGLTEAGEAMTIAVVGGDIGRADVISLSVAMTGATSGEPVLRSGARPGDLVCVTGALGGSAAGLAVLRSGRGAAGQSEPDGDESGYAIGRHLRPRPRIEEGERLAEGGATSMIDISDGLLLDLYRLMRASGTGCEIDPSKVPIDVPAHQIRALAGSAQSPFELATRGGEDYELLCTLPPAVAGSMRDVFSSGEYGLSVLGTVTEGPITFGDGVLDNAEGLGWDHLQNR